MADTKYPFKDNNSAEVLRLDTQYEMIKKLLGHGEILDVPFDKEHVTHILDVGAGSGAWALDVARIPEIKARSSPTSSNHVKLYISDITSTKFPSSSALKSLNITAFEQDVTKPFPEAMQGKFDIVHMSFLVWALKNEEWSLALKNIYDILRPGGYLLLVEGELVTSADPSRSEDEELDGFDVLTDGQSPASKVNIIFLENALQNNLVIRPSRELREMLEAASFDITSARTLNFPIGRSCQIIQGAMGESLAEYANMTSEGLKTVATVFTKRMLSEGRLEIPRGVKITSEEDRQKVVDEIYRSVKEEGLYTLFSEWVARKSA